jgi:hypothetical protein
MNELSSRRAMGVDVTREIQELLDYAQKYPALKAEWLAPAKNGATSRDSAIRKLARALRLNVLQNRLEQFTEVRKVKRGQVRSGFTVSGSDFGFNDALGCAEFLSRVTSTTSR